MHYTMQHAEITPCTTQGKPNQNNSTYQDSSRNEHTCVLQYVLHHATHRVLHHALHKVKMSRLRKPKTNKKLVKVKTFQDQEFKHAQ
jgi:hypothetical protein